MRLLNALELLLGRCEIWEKFAHRGVSLRVEMLRLQQNIILLRHQQLQDWRRLRNFRESNQAKEAFLWTSDLILLLQDFTLEEMQTVTDEHRQPDPSSLVERSRLQELWTYLETNLLAKPIGQYDSRLHIVEMLSQLLLAERSSPGKVQMGCVLGHFHHYAQLTRFKVERALERQRRAMDKEIQGLLKIARWDFSRHGALKETTRKGHYQLGKVIKKFDAFLQEPVVGYLATPTISTPDKRALEKSILHNIIYQFEDGKSIATAMKSKSDIPSWFYHRLRCSRGGMMEWVERLSDEVRVSLSNIDTITSTGRKRLVIQLKNRLVDELKIQLLVRLAISSFLINSVNFFPVMR